MNDNFSLENQKRECKAVIFGSSGLVGSHLLDLLLQDSFYSKIYIAVRTLTGLSHPRCEEYVIDFISKHQPYLESNQLSFFEMTVGMAFQYFAESKVDIAVVEVGLGGRLDSTNIITPEIDIINKPYLIEVKYVSLTLSKNCPP